MLTLKSTADVLDRRKLAIVGSREPITEPVVHTTSVDALLLMFSGFDVDRDELRELAQLMAGAAVLEIMGGHDAMVVLRSLYLDALALGMLHERRSRQALDGEKIDGD